MQKRFHQLGTKEGSALRIDGSIKYVVCGIRDPGTECENDSKQRWKQAHCCNVMHSKAAWPIVRRIVTM
jgi:hypothetical protein